MQNPSYKKLSWKTLLPTVAVAIVMLLAPLAGVINTVQAKPPRHAPAYGYRSSKRANWDAPRRSSRSQWRNGVRHRTRTRKGWSRDDHDNRRYRLRYRTRYDRNSNPYRQWYRSYF